MKLLKLDKIKLDRCEFLVELDKNEFGNALDVVVRNNVKSFTVPGFRKGKARRSMVEKYYGHDVFFGYAFKYLLPRILNYIEQEANTVIIRGDDSMAIEVKDANVNEGAKVQINVDVAPEVELESYEGLEYSVEDLGEVSDEDIKKEVNIALSSRAQHKPVERSIQNGDVVNIDFMGYIDGEQFDNGSAKSISLEIGSGRFIKGFEEQLLGKSVGEETEVVVNFPDDYYLPRLAGKKAVFKVKINSVSEKVLPEYNDEWVKNVSKSNSVSEYEDSIRDRLKRARKNDFEEKRNQQLELALVEKVKSDVPKALVDQRANKMFSDFEDAVRQNGIKMEDYLKFTGLTIEGIKENLRLEADQSVKFMLALKKIAILKNLTVEENEIDMEIRKIADQQRVELSKIPRDEVKNELLFRKSFDVVIENSVNKFGLEKKEINS